MIHISGTSNVPAPPSPISKALYVTVRRVLALHVVTVATSTTQGSKHPSRVADPPVPIAAAPMRRDIGRSVSAGGWGIQASPDGAAP
jgi:hypothetical protein